MDKGAILSRYSRTNKTAMELYETEFKNNETRGGEFYKKVFDEYGDDSVAELITETVIVEGISIAASLRITDIRYGMSFLEKSSRYVKYTPESVVYHLVPELDKFTDTAMAEYIEQTKKNNMDIARKYLPLTATTNIGIVGNLRAFEKLVHHLWSFKSTELTEIADRIAVTLMRKYPFFTRRLNSEHPHTIQMIKYLDRVNSNHYSDYNKSNHYEVDIVDYHIPGFIKKFSPDATMEVRENRRHELPFQFERANATFRIEASIGTFRDMKRHRLTTIAQARYRTYNKNPDLKHYNMYWATLGDNVSWYWSANFKEWGYIYELRSRKSGHPEYRQLCQDIYLKLCYLAPVMRQMLPFGDMTGRFSYE